jgi:hypothetical protein
MKVDGSLVKWEFQKHCLAVISMSFIIQINWNSKALLIFPVKIL